jgi:ribose 5-phosphate isomerase B
MKIAVGSDHHGLQMKDQLKEHLLGLGHDVHDHGCFTADEVDYPDVAVAVAESVASGGAERGVLVCGTGIGMAIAACKVPGVRAAAVSDPYSAERAQKSNNAQVLCLGAKVVGAEVAPLLVDHWLNSEFQGGASARKVAKIDALDDRSRATAVR